MSKSYHIPVLLEESLGYLRVEEKKKYIDATLGGGGHTFEVLERGGIVLGIDVDQEAINYVQENFQFPISNFQLRAVKGNFKDIRAIAKENGFEKVDGILFDLGVSSHQLDTPGRGFSFLKEGPLDMRMDNSLSVKAADLINILSKGELNELFHKLGEEYRARIISEGITIARKIKKIETTKELADIVKGVVGYGRKKIPARHASQLAGVAGRHPATKVFQALRIAVNDELNSLKDALLQSVELLNTNGRLVVISFHSLEDRIVKENFREFDQKGWGRILTKKPAVAAYEEVRQNPRSRSAKLRAFEKL